MYTKKAYLGDWKSLFPPEYHQKTQFYAQERKIEEVHDTQFHQR